MKLLTALIILTLLSGCSAFNKKPVTTNFDAPTARLDDVHGEASSISEALNQSTTHLNADADSLDALVNEGRALVPQLADYWNRLAKAVQKVRDDVPKSAADRQVALVTKIASVQQQVDALQKQNADLKAQLAKAQSSSGFFHSLDGITIVGVIVAVVGFGMLFYAPTRPFGLIGVATGIAAIVLSRVTQKVDALWLPLGIVFVCIISGIAIFYAVRFVMDQIQKRKQAEQEAAENQHKFVQVVRGTALANATNPKPVAELNKLVMKGEQDKSVQAEVNQVVAAIPPEELQRAKEKAETAAKAALLVTPLVPPSPSVPTLDGLVGQTATVAAGDATVSGPVVGSG